MRVVAPPAHASAVLELPDEADHSPLASPFAPAAAASSAAGGGTLCAVRLSSRAPRAPSAVRRVRARRLRGRARAAEGARGARHCRRRRCAAADDAQRMDERAALRRPRAQDHRRRAPRAAARALARSSLRAMQARSTLSPASRWHCARARARSRAFWVMSPDHARHTALPFPCDDWLD